jgi:predicted ATPase with chaperone activity
LALALACRRLGDPRILVLPAESAEEAALAGGLDIRSARHLLDVARSLRNGDEAQP